jgi:hypothetical protein
MITNYSYFLLESKGINDTVIKYSNIVFYIYKNLKFNKTVQQFTDQDFKLKDVKISFIDSGNSKFFADKNLKIDKDDYIQGFNFIFSIKTDIENEIKSDIIHEFTHAYEFYKLFKALKPIPFYNIIKSSLLSSGLDSEHPFVAFTHYMYLTLDNELNARVAQVYPFLVSLNTDDYKILLEELEKTNVYKKYVEISNFDVDYMYNYLIKKLEIENVCELVNKLNGQVIFQADKNKNVLLKSYDFLKIKIDKENLQHYFNNWKKLFKNKSEKHKEKLVGIIDKVIIDHNLKQNYSS